MRFLSVILLTVLLFLTSCNSCTSDEPVQVEESQEQKEVELTDSAAIHEEDLTEPDMQEEEATHDAVPGDAERTPEETNSADKNPPVETEKSSKPDLNANSDFPFINLNNGLDIGDEVELNLASFAVEDVAVVRGAQCNSWCGRRVLVENYNQSSRITVVVQIKWKIDKEKFEMMRVYEVPPGQNVELGCSQECETEANIKWKIVSAEYMD